jgi:hypothetical protein
VLRTLITWSGKKGAYGTNGRIDDKDRTAMNTNNNDMDSLHVETDNLNDLLVEFCFIRSTPSVPVY